MARTTAQKVIALLKRDYDARNRPDIDDHVAMAAELVNDVVQAAADLEITLTAARAELIERNLAAWSYCLTDRGFSSKGEQGASASFHGQTAMGLDANFYGQQAKVLDPTGTLLTAGSGATARADWLGKAEGDRLTYDQRN
jgi:hypothetical protein